MMRDDLTYETIRHTPLLAQQVENNLVGHKLGKIMNNFYTLLHTQKNYLQQV